MLDELKILLMFWWSSECNFSTDLTMKNSPVVDVMYKNRISEKGELNLFLSTIKTLPLVFWISFSFGLRQENAENCYRF